jgi:hypothetical protein
MASDRIKQWYFIYARCDGYGYTATTWPRNVMRIHEGLVLRQFVLSVFSLTPLANLHHLLICALSFSV